MRAITPKISDRRLGEEEEEEGEEEEEEEGAEDEEEGCRTVHHQISTNVTSPGFWGSPPLLASARNRSCAAAVSGGSGCLPSHVQHCGFMAQEQIHY